jgi:hypothetical protein
LKQRVERARCTLGVLKHAALEFDGVWLKRATSLLCVVEVVDVGFKRLVPATYTQPTTHVCLRLRLCLFVSILFACVLRVREWLDYACGCGLRMAMVVCACVGGCG